MKSEDSIQVILMPKGYGRASKEVREYIHSLEEDNTMYAQLKDEYEEEIKRQEKTQLILDNQNAELQQRINKALHLLRHNDIMDYRVFEERLYKILKG